MIEIIFSIFSFITYLVNWIRKDLGLWLGVVEAFLLMIGQIIKALAGFVSITPSRKDDALVNWIERY